MRGIPRRVKLLNKQLAALPDDNDPMLVSELDGYLAGIVVCPDLITPSEWLPLVWGGGGEDAAPVFENTRQAETLIGLIMEHYNAIADVLYRRPGHYAPIFDVDTRHNEVLWELWMEGFEAAMQLRPDAWRSRLTIDEDTRVALAGLVTLAAIARGESPLPKARIDELTEQAPDLIPYWVEVLNRWRIGQHIIGGQSLRPAPGAKVGRNDPCPCGSGKKYKKCCGVNEPPYPH
jgi:uncharacterized protein